MRHVYQLIWLCLLLTSVVGCRGCKQAQKPNETDEEARKKKQRLVSNELRALPFAADVPGNFVKPGHWYQANHKLKANYNDESLTATLTILDREKRKVPFLSGQVPIEFQRHLTLAVGQEKNIQLKFYQPEVGSTGSLDGSDQNVRQAELVALYSHRTLGTPILEETFPNKLLKNYQYNLVTLSRDPSRYVFWRALDCIVWPSQSRMTDERFSPHRVIDLKEDEFAAQFPNHLYAMTSISHIVVNDTSFDLMSSEQQEAIQDWLHFGGTIILNGPEAITGIETNFMKQYSPLIRTGSDQISAGDIELLNKTWAVKQMLGERTEFDSKDPIPKLIGNLSPGANWVPFLNSSEEMATLEGLIAEKVVGQGRVVMTTFPMNDIAFLRWPSYSSLIHNTILRKPRRDVVDLEQKDTKYADMPDTETNPIHTTRLRLWARDLDSQMARSMVDKSQPPKDDSNSFPTNKTTSLGAWNSQSLITDNARTCLQESSGISVPKINTIIRLLLTYLIILVPVNWAVFRAMGRAELAWAAAPVIAIAGAFAIAKSVQLDVGFTRSQTTFGFLELHNGYGRGHLSNYIALYTSLTTDYQAIFERDNGLVLPLESAAGGRKLRGVMGQVDYWYADETGAGMHSMPVLSNTTGLVHSEEMIDVGGALQGKMPDPNHVELHSELGIPIHDVGVISFNEQGQLLTGWLGNLEPGSQQTCELTTPEKGDRWRSEWDENSSLAHPNFLRSDGTTWTDKDLGNDLYLGPMLEFLSNRYPLKTGETIAVGWTDSDIGELKITPSAKQTRDRTVVLYHLQASSLPPAQPDRRLFPKIVEPE